MELNEKIKEFYVKNKNLIKFGVITLSTAALLNFPTTRAVSSEVSLEIPNKVFVGCGMAPAKTLDEVFGSDGAPNANQINGLGEQNDSFATLQGDDAINKYSDLWNLFENLGIGTAEDIVGLSIDKGEYHIMDNFGDVTVYEPDGASLNFTGKTYSTGMVDADDFTVSPISKKVKVLKDGFLYDIDKTTQQPKENPSDLEGLTGISGISDIEELSNEFLIATANTVYKVSKKSGEIIDYANLTPDIILLPPAAVCDPATPELCSSGFCDYVADDPGTLEPIYECR